MSTGPKSKMFLEQAGYRQRRLRDALRLSPFFGSVLLTIPLLWSPEQSQNATALTYIFAVWAMLIVFTALMSWALRSDDVADATKPAP